MNIMHPVRFSILSVRALLFAFLSWSNQHQAAAFHHDRMPRKCRIQKNLPFFSTSAPSVINPLTKRKILLGGPTYNEFLQEGKWVQQDGTLLPLDLNLLRSYQEEHQYGTTSSKTKVGPFSENDSPIFSDEWYPIRPAIFSVSTTEPDDNTPNLSEEQQDMLQKELLFVHKASGLHCVPPRDATQPSLTTMIQKRYQKSVTVKPCHRLDRDTSGIVVFGLTSEAHVAVSRQFEERTTSKSYLALVAGHPTKDFGTVELSIGKRKSLEGFNRWVTLTGDAEKDADIVKPREAVTKWKVQERFTVNGATFARVELEPQTGRGHQLRLHMKAIGHPLLGDTLHAPTAVAQCAPRLCLHAHRLQIDWQSFRLEATSAAPF